MNVKDLIDSLRETVERERPGTEDYKIEFEVVEQSDTWEPKSRRIPMNSRCWSPSDKTLSFRVDLRTPKEKEDYYKELERRYPNED